MVIAVGGGGDGNSQLCGTVVDFDIHIVYYFRLKIIYPDIMNNRVSWWDLLSNLFFIKLSRI